MNWRVSLNNPIEDRAWLLVLANLLCVIGALLFAGDFSLAERIGSLALVAIGSLALAFQLRIESKRSEPSSARVHVIPIQFRDPALLRGTAIFRALLIATLLLDLCWVLGVRPLYSLAPAAVALTSIILLWYLVARLRKADLAREGLRW